MDGSGWRDGHDRGSRAVTGAAPADGGPPSTRSLPRWTKPYRPLRARTLLLQSLVVAVAEAWLFNSYATRDARFDWATHLLVGFIAAAKWLSLYLLIAARPAQGQLLMILLFHLVAIVPEAQCDPEPGRPRTLAPRP